MRAAWRRWGTRMGIAVGLVATGGMLGLAPANGDVAKAKVNAARRLLEKIKLVDGEGSGLDADTVRGKTIDNVAAFRVVDSGGRELGIFSGDGGPDLVFNVVRRESGVVLGFSVTRDGFSTDGFFRHETANCSGARYIVDEASLVRRVQVPTGADGNPGKTAYYMGDPIQNHTFVAYERDNGGPGPCPPPSTQTVPGFCCYPDSPWQATGGPAASFDLSPFAPPFSIQ